MKIENIKFRGKDVYDPKSWIYGFGVIKHNDMNCGITHKAFVSIHSYDEEEQDFREDSVLEETVGMYTGLEDKNGTEIYEGDLLGSIDGLCLVSWDEEKAAFILRFQNYPYENLYMEEMLDDAEIIGNIHDNPELLETNNV